MPEPSRSVILSRNCAILVLAVLAGILVAVPSFAAGAEVKPLGEANYSVEEQCGAPQPGRATCMAEVLVPESQAAEARTHPLATTVDGAVEAGSPTDGTYGLRPEDIHSAYDLPTEAPGTQTVAIVDAFDDPSIESDLRVYDETFGLPECTTANGCFTKVNQFGQTGPLPEYRSGWAGEIGLDVETVHATCQNCKIILVEASSAYWEDLGAAEDTAVALGADVVSNSFGGASMGNQRDFIHPGVVIAAATGDWGYKNWDEPEEDPTAEFPASIPYVVAVGGTRLRLSKGAYSEEEAWYRAGSGCSTLAAPAWQKTLPDWGQVGCQDRRSSADVSAVAAPISGMAIYNSTSGSGWETIGGTSLATPIIAAAYALAGGAGGVDYPVRTLYAHQGAGGLRDITSGYNSGCDHFLCLAADEEASCGGLAVCHAIAGYDGPTGLGTPMGLTAFEADPAATPPIGPPVVEEPPLHTITIVATGSGAGTVELGIGRRTEVCSTTCSWQAPEGTRLYITASQGSGSSFLGWSGGGCSGTEACNVKLGSDLTVTADFESTAPSKTTKQPDARFHFQITSDRKGYKRCVARTSPTYRKALRAAGKAQGKARPKLLQKARKLKARRVAYCRREYLVR